ncbi:MAG: extracellular solute-binding protein, partial [Oscillospiraceae bacterium]
TPFPEPEAVKEALRFHLKFVALMPGETEYSTVNTLFLEGKADATIGGPWMVPSAREAEIDLGIAPLPTVDETGLALAPYSGVQGVQVLKYAAENKAEAVKAVLAALCAPQIGIDLALASGCARERGLLRRRASSKRRAGAGHAHHGGDSRAHAEHPRDGRHVDGREQPPHRREPLRRGRGHRL